MPAWFRATIIIVLVSNLAAMFNYPPHPWMSTRDNLVSRGLGSASTAMSPQSSIGSVGTIDDMLDTILRRLDFMEEKLQPMGRNPANVEVMEMARCMPTTAATSVARATTTS
jgi:hypothetical protein